VSGGPAPGAAHDRRRDLAIAAAVLSAVALVAVLWDGPDHRRIDFFIYAEAISSAANGSLYDFRYRVLGLGFTYPPFAAVLLWPLSVLPVWLAERTWLVLQVACSAGFLTVVGRGLAPRIAARRPSSRWSAPGVFVPLVVAAGLWTMPVVLNARIGQVNALLALFIVADVVLLDRRSRVAGLGTGLATAAKLTPALLIPFLWLAGHRRAAGVAVGAVAAATAVGALVHPGDTVRYFTDELFATERVGSLDNGYSNALRRATALLPGASATLVWLTLVIVVVVVAYRRAVTADRHGDRLTAFTLVMCASFLVSPITWGHHLFFLIPAVGLWLVSCRRPWQWAVGAVAVVALYDPIGVGEGPLVSAVRIGLLVVLVAALPVDGTRAREPVPA
jgi:alpha-1,2-mannosyltransferase